MTENINDILDAAFAKVTGRPQGLRDHLRIGSKVWRGVVRDELLSGYGVEDIAIKLKCKHDDVRAEVNRLRKQGALARWWRR